MSATIAQLVTVRSPRVIALRTYLQRLIDAPDRVRPPYLAGRGLRDLYVSPVVFKRRPRHAGQDALIVPSIEKENWRDSSQQTATRSRVDWALERKKVRHAVILGRPGDGKTLLVKLDASMLAQAALTDLLSQRIPIEKIVVPLCIRVSLIEKAGSLKRAVRSTVRAVLGATCGGEKEAWSVGAVVKHIGGALSAGSCRLLLDSLDEVAKPAKIWALLRRLRTRRCGLLVTSRIPGYNRSPLPRVAEYELTPLSPRQRREFIGNWFRENTEIKNRMLDLVQDVPHFGGLTGSRLLLTLACSTAEGHLPISDLRRVDLYRYIVPSMVRKVWDQHPRDEGDPLVRTLPHILQHLAWSFLCAHPARVLIADTEWLRGIAEACKELGLQSDSVDMLAELRATGLIVSPIPAYCAFLHRSFQDFLAAEHIVRQPDPVAEIEPFLWQADDDGTLRWQPAATETICFLAGRMDDPMPLLKRLVELDQQNPDRFRTMLLLVGRAMADVKETYLRDRLSDEIVRDVTNCWLAHPENTPVAALAHRRGIEALVELLRTDQDRHVQVAAARALGQIGSARALDPLGERLKNGACPDVRISAARALGQIGSERMVTALIHQMQEDPDERVRAAAASALGQIGGAEALEAMIETLQCSPYDHVRVAIMRALAEIGGVRAFDACVERMGHDHSDAVRGQAITCLGALGGEGAVEMLLTQLKEEPSPSIRAAAARALGETGSECAVPRLCCCLRQEPDDHVRASAAAALGEIGNVRGRKPLIQCLASADLDAVRSEAAKALGHFGDQIVFRTLLTRLSEESSWRVRAACVKALGELGERQGIKPLIDCLQHDRQDQVREMVPLVLAQIGGGVAVDALIDCLQTDGWDQVRVNAAIALGEIGDERAVPSLVEQIRAPRSCFIRWAAAQALGKIGSKQAIDALMAEYSRGQTALEDEDLGRIVARVARRTGRWIPACQQAP